MEYLLQLPDIDISCTTNCNPRCHGNDHKHILRSDRPSFDSHNSDKWHHRLVLASNVPSTLIVSYLAHCCLLHVRHKCPCGRDNSPHRPHIRHYSVDRRRTVVCIVHIGRRRCCCSTPNIRQVDRVPCSWHVRYTDTEYCSWLRRN